MSDFYRSAKIIVLTTAVLIQLHGKIVQEASDMDVTVIAMLPLCDKVRRAHIHAGSRDTPRMTTAKLPSFSFRGETAKRRDGSIVCLLSSAESHSYSIRLSHVAAALTLLLQPARWAKHGGSRTRRFAGHQITLRLLGFSRPCHRRGMRSCLQLRCAWLMNSQGAFPFLQQPSLSSRKSDR